MTFVLLLMAFWIFRSKDNLKWNITVFLLSVLVAFILYEKIRLPNLPFGYPQIMDALQECKNRIKTMI